MSRMSFVFDEVVHRTVYAQLQDFVQIELREPLRKAAKNKKELLKSIIVAIRNTCGDWPRNFVPEDDPAMKGRKDAEEVKLRVPRRNCGPSTTQLYMVRTMLESLIVDRFDVFWGSITDQIG